MSVEPDFCLLAWLGFGIAISIYQRRGEKVGQYFQDAVQQVSRVRFFRRCRVLCKYWLGEHHTINEVNIKPTLGYPFLCLFMLFNYARWSNAKLCMSYSCSLPYLHRSDVGVILAFDAVSFRWGNAFGNHIRKSWLSTSHNTTLMNGLHRDSQMTPSIAKGVK